MGYHFHPLTNPPARAEDCHAEQSAPRPDAIRKQLARIAATLDRPVAWFFAGTPAGRAANFGASPDPCQLLGCTRDGLRLAIAFNAIADRTTRGAIVAVAETTAHALAPAARRRAA